MKIAKRALLGAVTVSAFLVAPAAVPVSAKLSPDALRLLDPSYAFLQACGQGYGKERSLLPARVQYAMANGKPEFDVEPPLYDGMGNVGFPITTQKPEAHAYFNQGLSQLYGYNHYEAVRAFRAASKRDPDCAMCAWGEVYALGPNINAPFDPVTHDTLWAAMQRMVALRGKASPREQALIDALQHRHVEDASAERAPLDKAYAAAMLDVAKTYPLDDDIGVLAAEAVMASQPWDYWEAGGLTPYPAIAPAIDLVEKVIARSPQHPQAAHLYIHLMEASSIAAQAEAAADRLAKPLVPNSGHLVHMPGHLYYRVGRYADAIRVNLDAAKVDEAYLAASPVGGIYRHAYYPHNVHFIVSSAQMAGDMDSAIAQAQKLRKILSPDVSAAVPWAQPVDAAPYLAYAHFGTADQILALPAPDPRLHYVQAMYHFARATAYAQRRDVGNFDAEIAAMRKIGAETDWKPMTDGLVPVEALLEVAENVAKGRLAMAQKNYKRAVDHFRKGAEAETRVNYTEPPYWYYPVNQSLGGALYMARDYRGAKEAFMAALVKYPGNAWALWGLAKTQEKMRDSRGAEATMGAFKRAWLGKDEWLTMARL